MKDTTQPGRLDQQITLYRPTYAQDSYGQNIVTWTNEGTVWADVREDHGGESVKGGEVVEDRPLTLTIRGGTGVQTGWKLSMDTWEFAGDEIAVATGTPPSTFSVAETILDLIEGFSDGDPFVFTRGPIGVDKLRVYYIDLIGSPALDFKAGSVATAPYTPYASFSVFASTAIRKVTDATPNYRITSVRRVGRQHWTEIKAVKIGDSELGR